jgi:hypothetical protein
MRVRGELFVLLLMGFLLVVASVFSAQSQRSAEQDMRSGSSYSNAERGTRALYLWLDEMGYTVRRLQRESFELRREDGVLWIITPSFGQFISSEEAAEIVRWIEAGGTLVWIDNSPSDALFSALEVEAAVARPLLLAPQAPWISEEQATFPGANYTFNPLPPRAVPLLVNSEGRTAAIYQQRGEGELWLFLSERPFTNQGLFEPHNSALVEGILAHLPPRATMTFDEIHHGYGGPSQIPSLARVMSRSPWGWGLYYGAAVVALWMLLRGRRFGRSLPLPGEHLRREAGEYARSMAWLYRRARQRVPILRHHRERLKRRIAQRHRLPLIENDDAFVSAVARAHPSLDEAALRAHLHALKNPNVSEKQLLALARANDEWLAQLTGR